MKYIVMTLMTVLLAGCAGSNKSVKQVSYESFTKIQKFTTLSLCTNPDDNDTCVNLNPAEFMASGTIIGNNDDSSFILSAGHFCEPTMTRDKKISILVANLGPLPEALVEILLNSMTVSSKFVVNDIEGKKYSAKLIDYTMDNSDLCMLQTSRKMDHDYIRIAKAEPIRGEKLTMASAPWGSHYPGTTVILEGFYTGSFWHPFFEKDSYGLSDFPIVPGCSGSGVLNSEGELVSVAYSTNMKFIEDGWGVTLSEVHKFVNKNLTYSENVKHRKKFAVRGFSKWIDTTFHSYFGHLI